MKIEIPYMSSCEGTVLSPIQLAFQPEDSMPVDPAHEEPTPMTAEEATVVVVMPAYNAAKTVAKTHGDIPTQIVDRVILVDDASQDDTPEIARQGPRSYSAPPEQRLWR